MPLVKGVDLFFNLYYFLFGILIYKRSLLINSHFKKVTKLLSFKNITISPLQKVLGDTSKE